ncbi:MAG: hypothetical protein E7568_07075 [Ruminococcaceae bacterium]|nr:hypothetical protein [Oscillospiraceae bacterium]
MKKILLIILVVFIITGSVTFKDYREIQEIAVTPTLFIDTSDYGYSVTAQFLSADKEKNSPVSASGKTLEECYENLNKILVKDLSLSHTAVIAISTKLSSKEISKILFFFKDFKETPLSLNLIFAKSSDTLFKDSADYSLSEFLINNEQTKPLYRIISDCQSLGYIALPVIKKTEIGYQSLEVKKMEVSL